MKNITFSAQEEAIEKARRVASQQHSTLNELFREWLSSLAQPSADENVSKNLTKLWAQTSYLKVGRKLNHEEMNER